MGKSLNDTRPPFVETGLKFQSKEEEHHFKNAAISAVKFYEGEGSLFSAYMIVASGNRLFAGYIKPNYIEFFTISTALDPQWTHTYLCQALNILTINNDKDPGLYWTGNIIEPVKNIFDSEYTKGSPMKVSNVAVFAHGRIFYASHNAIYASDFIYSQGLALKQREAVLSASESQYPSSGDGFGAPSEMGQLTGLIVIPQSDTLNGHGDVIATCRNGMFSISPNRKVRNEWTNDPEMQKYILVGKGCASNDSITPFANQIIYRDSHGEISSLIGDIGAYQNRQEFQSISTDVNEYTRYDDNSPDIQFCNGFTTAKRMMMTVGHHKEASSLMGIHRYSMGMVSYVRQRRGERTINAWEGLWTGPRVVGSCVTNIGNNKRTFVVSYDTDKQNRIYVLDESSIGDDFVQGAYKPIHSYFSFKGLFFDEAPDSAAVIRQIEKVEGLLVQSNPISVELTYSTNGMNQEYPVGSQLTDFRGGGYSAGRYMSDNVCSVTSSGVSWNSKQAYYFTVHVYIVGKAKFCKFAIAGNIQSDTGFEPHVYCGFAETKSISGLKFNSTNQRANPFNYQF